MATKFFCENPDCDNYQKTITEGRVRYRTVKGSLIPEVKKCFHCNAALSTREEKSVTVPQISIGKFAGMTNEDKAATLKKRAEIFNKKDDVKGRKEEIRKRTVKKFFEE